MLTYLRLGTLLACYTIAGTSKLRDLFEGTKLFGCLVQRKTQNKTTPLPISSSFVVLYIFWRGAAGLLTVRLLSGLLGCCRRTVFFLGGGFLLHLLLFFDCCFCLGGHFFCPPHHPPPSSSSFLLHFFFFTPPPHTFLLHSLFLSFFGGGRNF